MKKFFSLLTAIIALVPGFLIIKTNLGVPPGESKELYGGIIEAICCSVMGLLILNQKGFSSYSIPRLNKIILISIGSFFLAIFLYFFLTQICVVEPSGSGIGQGKAFFPIIMEDELKEKVSFYGSKEKFLSRNGSDKVNEIIESSSNNMMFLTKIIFLINYILVFVSLTTVFGFLAIKQTPKD